MQYKTPLERITSSNYFEGRWCSICIKYWTSFNTQDSASWRKRFAAVSRWSSTGCTWFCVKYQRSKAAKDNETSIHDWRGDELSPLWIYSIISCNTQLLCGNINVLQIIILIKSFSILSLDYARWLHLFHAKRNLWAKRICD